MFLYDLLDETAIEAEIRKGRVSVRVHPTFNNLKVLNYTAQAQYDGHSETSIVCRGLVYDENDLSVLARPLPKFYNYNENSAPIIDVMDRVRAFEKADGSLIIVFKYAGTLMCCTRGSFISAQAIAAQEIIDDFLQCKKSFANELIIYDDETFLYEFVGPSNRIVLEYPEDKLVFLGGVNKDTGEFIFPNDKTFSLRQPFDSVNEFSFENFGALLACPPFENAEGFVVHHEGDIVKVKQEDYVELHRIIFNLTPKKIWEQMRAGKDLKEIIDPIPDEFHEMVKGYYYSIYDNAQALYMDAGAVVMGAPQTASRKAMAQYVKDNTSGVLTGLVFSMYDGKNIWTRCLELSKPKSED